MEEQLEKIYIDLPNDGVVGGESVWAKPLGSDLFEVRNSPWHAYDVHFGDVVRAIPRLMFMRLRINFAPSESTPQNQGCIQSTRATTWQPSLKARMVFV